MIEFLCQYCHAKLRVADEKAGKVARCPKCKTQISIPKQSPVGPADDEVVEELPAEAPPPAPAQDDSGENQPRKRKKRRKRRRAARAPGEIPVWVFLGFGGVGLLALWGIAMGLREFGGLFYAGLFALAVAGCIALCGRVWFLAVAFSEDSTTGALCLMLWPYSIYYLISNFQETWKAFVLECVGGFLFGITLSAGVLFTKEELNQMAPQGPPSYVAPNDDQDDPPMQGNPPVKPPGRK